MGGGLRGLQDQGGWGSGGVGPRIAATALGRTKAPPRQAVRTPRAQPGPDRPDLPRSALGQTGRTAGTESYFSIVPGRPNPSGLAGAEGATAGEALARLLGRLELRIAGVEVASLTTTYSDADAAAW